MTSLAVKTYFVFMRGDPSFSRLVVGEGTMRRMLREMFLGPGLLINRHHIEEEAARWAQFLDLENWSSDVPDAPRQWREDGEGYALEVTTVTMYPVLPGQSFLS